MEGRRHIQYDVCCMLYIGVMCIQRILYRSKKEARCVRKPASDGGGRRDVETSREQSHAKRKLRLAGLPRRWQAISHPSIHPACTRVTFGPKRGRWKPAPALTRISTGGCHVHLIIHPAIRSATSVPLPAVDLADCGLAGSLSVVLKPSSASYSSWCQSCDGPAGAGVSSDTTIPALVTALYKSRGAVGSEHRE
jgi:hypothetical protein